MRILDSIVLAHSKGASTIELCCGDLTEMEAADEVDILVVSAFPGDYSPTPTSLIGALDRRGISVEALANDKAADLRTYCCCWMSSEIQSPPVGVPIRRILCFEPLVRGSPPEMVEDIFRALTPFLNDQQPSYSVAMPLLASGDQAVPVIAMLGALVRCAYRWIQFGLPIRRLRIVERSPKKAAWLQDEFALVKGTLKPSAEVLPTKKRQTMRYLVSYALEDRLYRDELVQSLQVLRRQKTIDIWHEGLVLPGTNSDDEIRRHIDEDDVILMLASPDFLASDRCMAQAERALLRHERHEARLIPVLVRPAQWAATPFGSLPPLPTDGMPVTSWSNRDQAWTNISGGIRLLSMYL